MKEAPNILLWLLDKCCPDSRPDLKGDFLELYEYRQQEKGRRYANRKLLRDTISIMPLNFIIERKVTKPVSMFSTNIKIARRNLLKNKMYTMINIVGLSVSLTICILITLFIKDEISFDKHFEGANRIYRIAGDYSQGGVDRVRSAQTSYLVKPLIEKDVEGLESITRAEFRRDLIVVNDDKPYQESGVVYADSTLFDVFKTKFLKGDASTALDRPENVVLDRTTAIKYFGTDDALGKTVQLHDKEFVVTGVIEDLPSNTHFVMNIVFPISGIKQWYPDWVLTNASGTSMYTYIKVADNFSIAGFEAAVTKLISTRWGWTGEGVPKFFLQPLTSIHLESNLVYEAQVNGNKSTVYILAVAALVIFLLACINYINLTTAASFQRGKEVGMKKVFGSTKGMQVAQFQTESFMVAIISMMIALVLTKLAMPVFNELSGKSLEFNPFTDKILGPGLLILLILVGALAGSAPAFLLLRSTTMGMLRDKIELSGRKSYVRSGLIIFQFSISITLIACTLIVMDQISFIRNSDLGVKPESVVLIPLTSSDISGKHELLKTEMLRNPSVINVAASSEKVTERIGNWRQYKVDPSQKDAVDCPSTVIDYDYFETLEAKMAQGRTFKKEYSTDVLTGYILNESAVKYFNLQDPVGKNLSGTTFTGSKWFMRDGRIIGVVKDFHFASLHDKVEPVVFYLASDQTEGFEWMQIRISGDNMQQTIESLRNVWTNVAGDTPFAFEFMDEAVASHYQAEDRFLKIFTTFSILSIMLGGLGLFGLTAFMAQKRTKEIGIRRVLGASTPALINILSKDFLKLVLIANLIGWPVAWYFMDQWMANFAYHIQISLWIFVATGLSVFVIAFACILYHSLKVSNVNPVNSLRSE